jgi:hypothetical protein
MGERFAKPPLSAKWLASLSNTLPFVLHPLRAATYGAMGPSGGLLEPGNEPTGGSYGKEAPHYPGAGCRTAERQRPELSPRTAITAATATAASQRDRISDRIRNNRGHRDSDRHDGYRAQGGGRGNEGWGEERRYNGAGPNHNFRRGDRLPEPLPQPPVRGEQLSRTPPAASATGVSLGADGRRLRAGGSCHRHHRGPDHQSLTVGRPGPAGIAKLQTLPTLRFTVRRSRRRSSRPFWPLLFVLAVLLLSP